MHAEPLGTRFWRISRATCVVFLAACLTGCVPSVIQVDSVQERLDTATPPLDGTRIARQTILCRRPNLCQIELRPAVYETPGHGTLTFSLYEANAKGEWIAQQSMDAAQVLHNEPLRFEFSAQRDSAGKAYELRVEGGPEVRVGLWYSHEDAYAAGELSQAQSASGDLWFRTHCRYDPFVLLGDIRGLFLRLWELPASSSMVILSLAALLLVPGCLLRRYLASGQIADPVGNLAWVVALSLGVVPVVLLWSTTLGLRWDRAFCVAAYVVLSLCALIYWFKDRKSKPLTWVHGLGRPPALWILALFLVTLLWRFLQIRDLVLPAWVDSPQHALVAELVAMQGQVPRSYQPLLPVPYFVYHFGFHSVLAVFHWLSGLPIPQGMLVLGQVLNAACGLTAYLWTVRLTGRRLAGAVAVLVVGILSYFPAYYVSWGRYTQLMGVLLAPAVLVITMDWLETQPRNYRSLLVAGLLLAGLFLTHLRVTVFCLSFLLAYLIAETIAWGRHSRASKGLELWTRMGALGLLALALTAPWLVQLFHGTSEALRATGGTLQGDPAYNAFPRDLLWVPHNRELLLLAGAGVLWGLVHRRRETVWVLAGCGLVALVTNPGLMGLPNTNLLNNATAIIALFIPVAMWSGQAIVALWDGMPRLVYRMGVRPGLQRVLRTGLLMLLAAAGLWGLWDGVDMVNPVTVLATGEDMVAMDWISANTPENALFLINAHPWQQDAFTGTDAGYWIPRVTGRRTTLPEIPYMYGASEYVRHVTEIAQVVSAASTQGAAQLLTVLQQEGISYVYVGVKGGPLTPAMFVDNSNYRTAYNRGAVWIFEVMR